MNYHASDKRRYVGIGLTLLVMLLFTTDGRADGFVHREELQQKEQWVKEQLLKFQLTPTIPQPQRPETGLVVLANHGVVQANARVGQPLKIGDAQYTRGLYCHAVSRLVVHLPGPGQKFTAIVGVDSNTEARRANGSSSTY